MFIDTTRTGSPHSGVTCPLPLRVALRIAGICLLLQGVLACGPTPPEARRGHTNLFSWDYERDGPYRLRGEWEYYPDQALRPADFRDPREDAEYLRAPGGWSALLLPPRPRLTPRMATYRLEIFSHEASRLAALRIPVCVRSCRIWLGDELIASRGDPEQVGGTTAWNWNYQRLVRTDAEALSLPVVVQTRELYPGQGLDAGPFYLGIEDDLRLLERNRTVLDVGLSGALLILAAYFFGIYLYRRKDRAPLFFSGLALMLAVRGTVAGERILSGLWPDLNLHVVQMLDSGSFYAAMFLLAAYVRTLFPGRFSSRTVRVMLIALILGLLVLLVFALPFGALEIGGAALVVYDAVFGWFTVAVVVFAAFKVMSLTGDQRWDALWLFPGLVFFAFAVLYEGLFSVGLAEIYGLIPAAYLAFMLSQAVMLSTRFSGEFAQVENLSQRLAQTNTELKSLQAGLEDRVRERTAELEQAREEAVKLNEFARRINSSGDLDDILHHIFTYLEFHFDIDCTLLQFVDSEKNELYYYRMSSVPAHFTDDHHRILKETRIPVEQGQRLIGRALFDGRRPVYYSKIRAPREKSERDRSFFYELGFRSFLMVPLVIEERIIGLIHFTNFSREFRPARDEIARIARVCDQIAGAVRSSLLLNRAEEERAKADRLLVNILPGAVAEELKEKGSVDPLLYESVTICFTDFKAFTAIAESMDPDELLRELDGCFTQFDLITERYGIERLKTIGDAYMCAGGLPRINYTHPVDVVLAALEIQDFMTGLQALKEQAALEARERGFEPDSNDPVWELRLGIHTGPVMAGVIGKKKFAYDVWGDTVNVASRMETEGVPGRINISGYTSQLVSPFFETELRGEVALKHHGSMDMYFVNRLRPEYSDDEDGRRPNAHFREVYERKVKVGALYTGGLS